MAMASGYPAGALKNAFVYKNPDFANWILCDDFDSQVIAPPDTPGVNGSSLGTIWAALEDPGPKDTEGINPEASQLEVAEPSCKKRKVLEEPISKK